MNYLPFGKSIFLRAMAFENMRGKIYTELDIRQFCGVSSEMAFCLVEVASGLAFPVIG